MHFFAPLNKQQAILGSGLSVILWYIMAEADATARPVQFGVSVPVDISSR
jgi:hypothetical protein